MLHKSPLTFKFVSEPLNPIRSKSQPGVDPVGVASPIELHFVEGESETTERSQTAPSSAESDPIKTFTLWVELSQSHYRHKTRVRMNPIHGPWPVVKKTDHDFAYFALKEVVPESLAQQGLCDWVTGGQLSEDVKLARADEDVSKSWQLRATIQRRRNRERSSANKQELTSWTSIKSALQPQGDAFAEAFRSSYEPASSPTDKSVDDESGSEAVSEPLLMDSPLSQALDSQQNPLEGQDSASDQAPISDHQRDGGDSISASRSTSQEILQKILRMPASGESAPALDSDSETFGSESHDQRDQQQRLPDLEKDTWRRQSAEDAVPRAGPQVK